MRPVTGEAGRFFVESAGKVNGEVERFVDLGYYPVEVNGDVEANGRCDCQHFTVRLSRVAQSGALARCHHIDAVFNYLGRRVASMLVASGKETLYDGP